MNKKAFSLVLTLWIVAMIGLVSVLYLSYSKRVIEKSFQLYDKLEVRFQAESVIELLNFYASTGNIRLNYIENKSLKSILPTFPTKIQIDSKEFVWRNTKISLQDTAGLISIENIKMISHYTSEHISKLKDKESIITNSIKDWLDKDDFLTASGAENPFYKPYGYGARNRGYFAAIDELFLLRGMEDLSNLNKETLNSLIVISSLKKRNISTLPKSLLQSYYSLSKSDSEILNNLKIAGKIQEFQSFFNLAHKENFSIEIDGFHPSGVIKMNITSSKNEIKSIISLLVSFHPKNKKAFRILNYKN